MSAAAFDTSVLSARSTVHGSVRGSEAFSLAGAPLLEDGSPPEDEAPSAPSDEPPSGAADKVDGTDGAPAGESSPIAASPESTDKSRDSGGPGALEEELSKNHDEQQALAALSEELRSHPTPTFS